MFRVIRNPADNRKFFSVAENERFEELQDLNGRVFVNRVAEIGEVLCVNTDNNAAVDAGGSLNLRDLRFPFTSQAYGSGKTALQHVLGRMWTEAAADNNSILAGKLAKLNMGLGLNEWKEALQAAAGARTVYVMCGSTAKNTIDRTAISITEQFGFDKSLLCDVDKFRAALKKARRIAPVILCWDEIGNFANSGFTVMPFVPEFESPTLRRIVQRLDAHGIGQMQKARHEFHELRDMYMIALQETAAASGEQGVHPVYCLAAGRLSLPLSLMFAQRSSSSPYTNRHIAL